VLVEAPPEQFVAAARRQMFPGDQFQRVISSAELARRRFSRRFSSSGPRIFATLLTARMPNLDFHL
jgi:hypothetical protein